MVSATSAATEAPHDMAETSLDPHALLPQLAVVHGLNLTAKRPQGAEIVSATSLATDTPHDMAETVVDLWRLGLACIRP